MVSPLGFFGKKDPIPQEGEQIRRGRGLGVMICVGEHILDVLSVLDADIRLGSD